MSVLDTAILSEVQFLLLQEQTGGATWSSGMWTPEEVDNYLSNSQQDLVVESGLILKRQEIPTIPELLRQALPMDWLATYAMAWKSLAGVWYPLERAETWELDAILPDWRQVPAVRPRFYTETDGQSLSVQVVPAAFDAGILQVLYLPLPAALGHSGAAISVPDDFSPGLVWKTIYRMLQKAGRATDPARAVVAKQLSDLTVESARLILSGRG